MVPFIIYWGSIFVLAAWLVITVVMSLIYLANKENGNLWVFSFLNVLAIIFGLIIFFIYNGTGFGVSYVWTQTLLLGVIIAYAVTAVLGAFLGREPKPKAA